MNAFVMLFPASGVETWVFLPPLVALIVSSFTSLGGVSGAFVLLPFQMSVLGFTGPAVSSTNLVYNIVAIPSGVYRFIKEGRMAWPLAWTIVAGTLPGVFLGYMLRVRYLPDPRDFKLFAGCVLLFVGARLLLDTAKPAHAPGTAAAELERKFADQARRTGERSASGLPIGAVVRTVSITFREIEYEFWGERFHFSVPGMLLLAGVVGVIGGAYGIGGGAFIAPFCVAAFRLPIHTVAGAALLATFMTSLAGVAFYSFVPGPAGQTASPDWMLGFLFGIGGFGGMYIGARLQKYVSPSVLKRLLGGLITALAAGYIVQFIVR